MSKGILLSSLDMNLLDLDKKTELCQIMNEERSDKGNGWHNYTVLYHFLFQEMRNKPIKLFEMGLGSNNVNIPSNMGLNGRPGASLYGWDRYFLHPESLCWGADIDSSININKHKIRTFYSDQLNADVMQNMWMSAPLANHHFDIIIDDGLHTFQANKNMFENSIYKVNTGGIYIIEDINKNEYGMFSDYVTSLEAILSGWTIKLLDIPNPANQIDNICLFVQKRYLSDFTAVFNSPVNTAIFEHLNSIMMQNFNEWRGIRSYLINGSSMEYEERMLPKQENLFEYAKGKKKALEIGVHGGHSLFIMLLANPNIHIDAIDICTWGHTERCVEYLNRQFNNRIKLIKGDSLESLRHISNSSNIYDLVHLDGDHDVNYVMAEFGMVKNMLAKNAIVVFDDIETPNVTQYVLKNPDLIVLDIPKCAWPHCVTGYVV